MSSETTQMKDTMPQVGCVQWIGLRPGPRETIQVVEKAELDTDSGLVGDRFNGGASAKRQVTLIQSEHLDAIANILGIEKVDPSDVRRNIVVSGINLQSLKERTFRIGSALLKATGNCPPCSRMEENLGPGGYNAMCGHGGITAYVVKGGLIGCGDSVQLELEA